MSKNKFQIIEIITDENCPGYNVKTSTLYNTQGEAEEAVKLLVKRGLKHNFEPSDSTYGAFSMRDPSRSITFVINEVKPSHISESVELSDDLIYWLTDHEFCFDE